MRKLDLYDFVGVDVWIKAFDVAESRYWYINVQDISIDTGKMTYNAIAAEYIEGTWELDTAVLYDIDLMLDHPTYAYNTSRDFVHNWELVMPVETLTSEEIADIVHSYPVYEEDEEE